MTSDRGPTWQEHVAVCQQLGFAKGLLLGLACGGNLDEGELDAVQTFLSESDKHTESQSHA